MPILTKEVEVKPSGKSFQYYKNLGYDVKWRQPIIVRIEDLLKGSKAKVEILCDMCKENTMFVAYDNYNSIMERTGSYVCRDCAPLKSKQTVRRLYNVNHISQLEKVKEKKKQTCMEHYNTEHPMQSEIVKSAARKTMVDKYGAPYALQVPEFKQKAIESCIRIYGTDNPNSLPEIRKKLAKSLYENSSQKCSKQQLYIYNLYNLNNKVKLNFPVSYCSIDICLIEEKIAIEYDGGGHNLRVTFGRLTQEEFDHKELVRDKVIKHEGYRQMRIISTKDLLPSDKVLLQMLEEAKQYFSNYSNHSWIEFNIDTSTVYNAEHKDGIFFDFGELRKINKADVSNADDNQVA